ncbi:hypothetical protein BDV06DRAFT_57661 [Aspergillus oleicola]
MPLPKPHITKNSFFHEVPSSESDPSSPYPTTIYFISGNPGLISYYHVFLSLLGGKLTELVAPGESGRRNAFHVVGHSLAGFELEPGNGIGGAKGNGKVEGPEHYSDVKEQIHFVLRRLDYRMRALCEASCSEKRSSQKPKVILIGHSVGTYMGMEIIRRHRERQAQAQGQTRASEDKGEGAGVDFDIIGGIMLFPTVMDIADSPSGRKLTFLLRLIPQLALVASLFVRLLTTLLPESFIRALIRAVMRSPPEEAVDATASFLKSRRGVRQALHMATDEMRVISRDKWDDEVWGISAPAHSEQDKQQQTTNNLAMYFYFGRNDHWVAERTREDIIALRGSPKAKSGSESGDGNENVTRPKMFVCEESVPHAFCLRHNETMAGKVANMIKEILA